MKTTEVTGEHYTASAIGFVLGLGVFAVRAWATWLMWGWFAVPIGAPAITFAATAGLMVVVNMFNVRVARREDRDAETKRFAETPWTIAVTEKVDLAVGYAAAAGLGWCLHWVIT